MAVALVTFVTTVNILMRGPLICLLCMASQRHAFSLSDVT